MDRATLDETLSHGSGAHFVLARPEFGGHKIPLTDQQFTDLISVHLADWLQQVSHRFSLSIKSHFPPAYLSSGHPHPLP